MISRISYNIHAQMVTEHDRLMRHLDKIKPVAVLVMDGLGLAREIKQMLPATTVISRIYPDEDVQNRISVEKWHEQRAREAEGGIFQYTSNEAGFSPNLIQWHIKLLKMCIQSRTPLVIGNMSVGTPAPEDWAAGRELLELLDKYRDLFILGLHEYATAVITSGFLGGYPDNAGVEPIPANAGKGRNLIQPENWPSKIEAATMTMFHCGRFKFLVNYCKSIGLKPPRIMLTEHGFDDVSDIKKWNQSLPMTPPFTTVRGWQSSINVWRRWYEARGWSPQRAMFEQIAYADRTIYQGSPVEAQLMFCWAGKRESQWDQFNLSRADEFQELLESYAAAPPAPVPVPPPPVPVPIPPTPITWIAGWAHLKAGTPHVALYTLSNTATGTLANIAHGAALEYDSVGMIAGWWRVRYQNKVGYVESAYFHPDTDKPVNEGGLSEAETLRLGVLTAKLEVIYTQIESVTNEINVILQVARERKTA